MHHLNEVSPPIEAHCRQTSKPHSPFCVGKLFLRWARPTKDSKSERDFSSTIISTPPPTEKLQIDCIGNLPINSVDKNVGNEFKNDSENREKNNEELEAIKEKIEENEEELQRTILPKFDKLKNDEKNYFSEINSMTLKQNELSARKGRKKQFQTKSDRDTFLKKEINNFDQPNSNSSTTKLIPGTLKFIFVTNGEHNLSSYSTNLHNSALCKNITCFIKVLLLIFNP